MSNDVQIPMEDRVRSLERSEAQVLYGRCHDQTHGQIATKYRKTSDTWSRNLMTAVFEKVGAKKSDSRNKKNDFLKRKVCPVLDEILQGDEANLESWPLYGWVALREGDNVQYREREEYERVMLNAEESTPEPEEADLTIEDEDEVDELTPSGRDEVEDVEEAYRARPATGSIPPPIPPATASRSPEPEKDFAWRPPQNQQRNRFWLLASTLICIACVGVGWFTVGRVILPLLTTALASTPTYSSANASANTQQISIPTETPPGSPTPADTSTPKTSQTPEETATSVIPPTAVPLPIIENFDESMKKVWQVTGDPILTTSKTSFIHSGVLTTLPDHFASIAIGNIAWSDYIIHTRVQHAIGNIFLGFRVKDLNNMLGIECEAWNCNWVAIDNGVKETLSTAQDVYMQEEFTLTLEGENFNGISSFGSGFDERHPFLVLPPKYQGKFLNGGIYIRFKDIEIDYIEILPIR